MTGIASCKPHLGTENWINTEAIYSKRDVFVQDGK